MLKLNDYPLSARVLDSEDIGEHEHSQVAELAWEYCKKVRHGENPSKNDYYERLHDAGNKEEFDFLVGMNEFVEHAIEHQIVNSGS